MSSIHEDLIVKADLLGIKYSENTTENELLELISKKLEGTSSTVHHNTVVNEAFNKLRKVVISCVDQKESGLPTVYVRCSNSFQDLARVLPVEKEIEVEQALLNVLSEVQYVKHINKISNTGNADGNKQGVLAKKYVINYLD